MGVALDTTFVSYGSVKVWYNKNFKNKDYDTQVAKHYSQLAVLDVARL